MRNILKSAGYVYFNECDNFMVHAWPKFTLYNLFVSFCSAEDINQDFIPAKQVLCLGDSSHCLLKLFKSFLVFGPHPAECRVTPGSSLKITQGWAQGTIGDSTWISCIQSKHPTHLYLILWFKLLNLNM